jgi:hypothetical protein
MALHAMSAASAAQPFDGPIDDFAADDGLSRLGTTWRLATDRVMGGVSRGEIDRTGRDGRRALCLRGEVSPANDGGFIRASLDLAPGAAMEAQGFSGVRLVVRGNGQACSPHGKTALPWQAYRASFAATSDWREVRPVEGFAPHRLEATPK